MSEMVERVARRMFKLANPSRDPDKVLCPGDNPDWMAFEDQARRAIEAMREPTEGMVDAGYDFTADPCWREDFIQGYHAMIDEALK